MNIKTKTMMLTACAVIALAACSKKDKADAAPAAESAAAATEMAGAAIDKSFKLKNAEPFDVDAFLTDMGAEGALVYDSSDFDKQLGATVLTNVRLAGEQSPFTIGKLELFGVNTATIEELKSDSEMTELGDVFRKIRLYDFDATFPMEGTDGMGTISVDALDIDSLAIKGGKDDSFANIANSIGLGGIAMAGLDLSIKDAPEIGNLMMTADDFRIGSYKAGKFGGMKMAGVNYTLEQSEEAINEAMKAFGPAAGPIMNSPLKNILFPEQQSGTIGKMSWDGAKFDGLLGYLEKDEKPPVTAKNLLSIGGMSFANVTQDINGKRASSVKKMTISPIEFEHFMPKSIKMVSEGEQYDMTALVGDDQPEIVSLLKKNGLDKVTGSSKLDYNYSPKNKSISIKADSIGKGLMNSAFDLKIGNFDYPTLASGEGNAEEAAMGITVEGMTLKLDDEKLLDTGFAIAGQVMEQDPAQLRQQVVGLISLGTLQGAAISPRIPDYATALSAFVSEGGALEIKIDPKEEASVSTLAAVGDENPGEILEKLNLTVTRSK